MGRKILRPLLLLTAALLMTGCATMSAGPKRLSVGKEECKNGPSSQSIRNILVDLQCTNIDWLNGDSPGLQMQRNNVVTIRMFLIDKQYNDWERTLSEDTRSGNLTATLASLGLSGAGSVIAQGKTSKTLAALNTALTGAKQSYDKDILLDRTIAILMTQMRASRAKVRELLIKRLNTAYAVWPIGLAMSDLEAYEQAGTINAALLAVAENSAAQKQANEDRAEQALVTLAYDGSAAGTALQDYINSDDAQLATTRANRLIQAMTDIGLKGVTRKIATDFATGPDARKRDVILKLMEVEKADANALLILAPGLSNQ